MSTIEAELRSLNDCLNSCQSLGTSKRTFSSRLAFARQNPEQRLVSISRLLSYVTTFQLCLQTEVLVRLQRSTAEQEVRAIDVASYASDHAILSVDLCSRTRQEQSSDAIPSAHSDSGFFFFGERYSYGAVRQQIFVTAIARLRADRQVLQYFLTYAQTPRRWQRIVLEVDFTGVPKSHYIPRLNAPDSSERRSADKIPESLTRLLKMLLPQFTLQDSVNKICLSLRKSECGDLVLDSPLPAVITDSPEAATTYEGEAFRRIQQLKCPVYTESDVAVVKHRYAYTYHVLLGTKWCVLRRVPFAKEVCEAAYSLQNFVYELRLHFTFGNCRGVVPFMGVVLDDERRTLKGYLLDFTKILGGTSFLFENATQRNEKIPLSIRESWAHQMLAAVIEVHSKGRIVGNVYLRSFVIDAEGRVVLCKFTTSSRETPINWGCMPPEWRVPGSSDGRRGPRAFNRQTDFFQLGLLLWCVLEHKPNLIGGTCDRNACTWFPRWTCPVHANPVELPPCQYPVAPRWKDFIKECRSLDPNDRPSTSRAREVLQ